MKYFLTIILNFGFLFAKAQVTNDNVRTHLSFCDVSMNNRLQNLTDSLLMKTFVRVDSLKGISALPTHVYLKGRFENMSCGVDIGQNEENRVDTLKVYLNNVNNPILSFKILTNFYRSKYGSPMFDNYSFQPANPIELKRMLSIEPYIAAFSVAGGIIQFELKYFPQTCQFVYSVMFIDTPNALPVIPKDDAVIEW